MLVVVLGVLAMNAYDYVNPFIGTGGYGFG
jgi:hypothetical protein